MTRRSSRHTLAALPMLVGATLFIGGAQAGGARHIAAQTVYLHEAIEGFHTITIVGDLGGQAVLRLDPNSCTINEFGDYDACTLLPPSSRQVTLKPLAKPDAAGRGRTLYSIDGSGLSKPLLLVVPAKEALPLRLVYGDRGPGTPRPITLEAQ